ncbi:MAG: helix-turn-helix domain-containing protein [Lentisphaeria bacterium]|nr:MAG: helix-turn-helix domain-containing protein [Lentisphaeria bacterium]
MPKELYPVSEDDLISGETISPPILRPWFQRLTASWGLIFVRDGHGALVCDDKSLVVEQGMLILMTPGFCHQFLPEPGWELLWFHFLARPHVTEALRWPPAIPGAGAVHFTGEEETAVRETLSEVHQLELRRPPGWNPLAMLLLESVLVRGFNRIQAVRAEPDSAIRLAQELLLNSGDSVDRIAARCGMSRAALFAKFRQATGISPRQYRECAMLRRAARLLEQSGLPVSEVAEQSGMPDPYYFSTRFHKYFGLSPREYRRRAADSGDSV